MDKEENDQGMEMEARRARPNITVNYSPLVEGIGLVFTGVAKMLSAIDASMAQYIAQTGDALREYHAHREADTGMVDQSTDVNATMNGDTDRIPVKESPKEMNCVEEVPPWDSHSDDIPQNAKPEHAITKKPSDEGMAAIRQDDITKIIVRKLKQNRSNNEKIGAILKTYGVGRVSDLPESKYEAFLTDLSQI